MNFPKFYNAKRVGDLYTPDIGLAVEEGQEVGVSASETDDFRVALLLIDMQVDFIHQAGSLSVPGAIDDTRRTIEWIIQNVGQITMIVASLDSHVPIQIFSPTWWVDADGKHPNPFTMVTADEVQNGVWKPLYEVEWSHEYVQQLETHAKKQLMIWPYHTLIGTNGSALMPALYETIAYHTSARQTQPIMLPKGSIPKTENYSIFEPEVKVDDPRGQLNTDLLDKLAEYDLIYIAGQAKSHCVLETVQSMTRYYANSPETLKKLRLLSDCTSSVVSPGVDFEAIANEAYAEMQVKYGLQLVTSGDAIR